MKLTKFRLNGQEQVGVIEKNQVYSLQTVYKSIEEIIDDESYAKTISNLIKNKDLSKVNLEEIDFDIPLMQPKRNIFCIGWNYLNHFKERHDQSIDLPQHPTVFTKATTTMNGPNSVIRYSKSYTEKLDYEAELAVIIGKNGIDISIEEAEDHIFGYAVANDISARDVQFMHGGQWFLGKSMDGSCPMGPYIVTKDEIIDIQSLDITSHVNGLEVQRSNTSLMMFSVKEIIAKLSTGMTLKSGDIILTGTPAGIGSKRTPPLYLKDGDQVDVEIRSLGKITNLIKEG